MKRKILGVRCETLEDGELAIEVKRMKMAEKRQKLEIRNEI